MLQEWFDSYHQLGHVTRALEKRCKERYSGMVLSDVEIDVVTPRPISATTLEMIICDEQNTRS